MLCGKDGKRRMRRLRRRTRCKVLGTLPRQQDETVVVSSEGGGRWRKVEEGGDACEEGFGSSSRGALWISLK